MLGSEILDVAIGLIFIFLLLSLMCSAVKEMLEAWMKKRAIDLEKGIRMLLQDINGTALVKELYEHPLICSLFHGKYISGKKKTYFYTSNLPSYIPSRAFALAIMDIVFAAKPINTVTDTNKSSNDVNVAKSNGSATEMTTKSSADTPSLNPSESNKAGNSDNTDNKGTPSNSPQDSMAAIVPNSFKHFLDALAQFDKDKSNGHVKRVLMALANDAENDVGKLRENIEAWYNSSMERVSGWYKRHSQRMLLLIAFIITVGMNVNTIDIANHLFRDKALRDSLVAQAEVAQKTSLPGINDKTLSDAFVVQGKPEERIRDIEAKIQNIGLPIGWSQVKCDGSKLTAKYIVWNCFLLQLFGWGLTIFAISMGAPFWFDLLGKFMKIRSTIKPGNGGAEKPAGGQ